MPKIGLVRQLLQATGVKTNRRSNGASSSASSGKQEGAPKDGAATRVQISPKAKQLLAATGAPVDAKRVAEIKKALANGSYHVDSGTVANKIAKDLAEAIKWTSGQ